MAGIIIGGGVTVGGNVTIGTTVLDLTKYLISQTEDNFVSETGNTFIEE